MSQAILNPQINLLKSEQDSRFNRMGLTIGICSGFLWGLNNLLFSLGYALIPEDSLVAMMGANAALFAIPLACAAINDTAAAIALLLFNGSRGMAKEVLRTLRTKPGLIVCCAALIGGPISQSAYFLGSAMAGPAYALTITALYPIIGCILSSDYLKQAINSRMWFGIFLSVLGAIIVSYAPPEGDSTNFTLGLLCAGIAALGWGTEIVLATFGMSMVDPDIAITLREMTSGLVLSLIVLPVVGGWSVVHSVVQIPSALSFLVAAGAVAGFSYLMWYSANNKVGCAKGMAMNSTFIIWGVLLNIAFGNITEITPNMIIGCLSVLIGVTLVSVNPLEFIRRG